MKETLNVFIKDGLVVLETSEGYYHMEAKAAAELGWIFLKLAFKLDKNVTHAAISPVPEPTRTLQ